MAHCMTHVAYVYVCDVSLQDVCDVYDAAFLGWEIFCSGSLFALFYKMLLQRRYYCIAELKMADLS